MPARDRAESDRILCHRFLKLPQVAAAGTLLLFWGMGGEPDTRPILEVLWKEGKGVLLPKCLPDHILEARLVRSPQVITTVTWRTMEAGRWDCAGMPSSRTIFP